jgi:hypothetical protein
MSGKTTTAYRKEWTERKRAQWLAEHGETPFCQCGCGERVKLDANGRPRKYAGKNHHMRTRQAHERLSARSLEFHEQRRERDGSIPIEKFRAACKQLKEDKGWSWKKLATEGGINPNYMRALMHDKRLKSVSREWATNFFRRTAGLAAPPSKYQLKRLARVGRAEREIGV